MPPMGYFIAVATAMISAFTFPGLAGAGHPEPGFPGGVEPVAGDDPYWTCRASVARATLLNRSPPIEPLIANAIGDECVDDTAGAPTIALPSPPESPVVAAGLGQASTEVLCANDQPGSADDEACDKGRSFEQQVASRADAAAVDVTVGTGADAIRITADAANTTATARCGNGNVPVLGSTSNVLNIAVAVGGEPIPIQPVEPDVEQVHDLGNGNARLTLNEVDFAGGTNANGVYEDNAGGGQVTRRAIHLEVPGGTGAGSTADVVVAESIADFHGDVCPEGRIVIRKETFPDRAGDTTPFRFTTSPPLDPPAFDLRDDGEQRFDEVRPSTPQDPYTVTEAAAPGYSLAAINCAENPPDDDSSTNVSTRTATINVGPGETVTCTFINAICPPDSQLTPDGECVILQIRCPDGSTLNNQGQCIINATTCPPGSTRPDPNGPCVANRPDCPPGSTRNPQGQCVVTSVQCPPGTTLNPVTRACTEAPRGGVLVPLTPQLQNFFRASPCIGQGFGPLVGIFGTNGPDRITGTNASDRIFALGGSDRVSGGRGDDCVEGGSGRDVLDGSNGNDFLLGGTGNDRVAGGPGRDRLSGGSGRDVMSGGIGHDRLSGGGGHDRLQGGYGSDRLVGGSGNDGIHTGNGRGDRVFAGRGNDIINAATVGPPAFVDCGPGNKDRVRINRNEVHRVRNCEFVDVPRRIRSNNRPQSPR